MPGKNWRARAAAGLVCAVGLADPWRSAIGQPAPSVSMPRLHHVGLNSVDPERAIAWYLSVWPAAKRATFAGYPAVEADMMLLFSKVDRPPPGAWRNALHRSEAQSAFWHIGAFINTSDLATTLRSVGVTHLPLFTSPTGTGTVWRSGLAPYTGTLSATQFPAPLSPPRPGGFSYVVAPDGVLFEFTGGPDTRASLSHVHFFHERPLCAANWYVHHLGFELPPARDTAGTELRQQAFEPCEVPLGAAGWPSLEPVGTIRQPSGTVRHGNGSMGWYPRQCVGTRCGTDQPLVPSRGQALDHVAFSVADFDALFARLERAGVTILEAPHPFGATRAFMIQDPDGLAIELVARP